MAGDPGWMLWQGALAGDFGLLLAAPGCWLGCWSHLENRVAGCSSWQEPGRCGGSCVPARLVAATVPLGGEPGGGGPTVAPPGLTLGDPGNYVKTARTPTDESVWGTIVTAPHGKRLKELKIHL